MFQRQESEKVLNSYGFFVSPEEVNAGETLDARVVRRREQKWLDMFSRWPSFIQTRFDKIKLRCRKGIPASVRGQAWYHLSAAKYRQEKEDRDCSEGSVFSYYLTQTPDARTLDDIRKDLPRAFPEHEMFQSDSCGQQSLSDVLRAYAVHDPDVGYCQAQAPIASILLMHLPPEQAFWVFVQINEEYVKGYFSVGLMAVKVDALATELLMQQLSPKSYQLLRRLRVDPLLYTLDWYMTLFSRTFTAPDIYRIWDMFFCEGVKVLFRISLAIVQETLEVGSVDLVSRAHRCDNDMDLAALIKQTAKQIPFETLLTKVTKLSVTDLDLAQACKKAREQLAAEIRQVENRKK